MSNIIPDKRLQSFSAWLLAEKGMSPNTCSSYVSDVSKFLAYLDFIKRKPEDIDINDLHHFIAEIHDLGISSRSQARLISSLRSYYIFLKMEGRIMTNPALLLEPPSIGLHLPEVLTLEEIDSLISNCDNNDILERRNRTIIEMLYSCGLRVSELVTLQLGNIYLDEGFVLIKGKGSKERLVPLSSTAQEALIEWIVEDRPSLQKENDELTVFLNRRGRPLTRNMVFVIIKRLADKTGITKNISPHTFRHSFATHLLDGGASLHAIKQMLGHEDISTTEIYLHIDRSQLREQILTYHPRNRK